MSSAGLRPFQTPRDDEGAKERRGRRRLAASGREGAQLTAARRNERAVRRGWKVGPAAGGQRARSAARQTAAAVAAWHTAHALRGGHGPAPHRNAPFSTASSLQALLAPAGWGWWGGECRRGASASRAERGACARQCCCPRARRSDGHPRQQAGAGGSGRRRQGRASQGAVTGETSGSQAPVPSRRGGPPVA